MALTVIMPMYNAAPTVVAAAESILGEPVDDLELLVIDDGSADGGAQRLRHLADARIRIVRQENAGLVAALNRGLDEARGDLIARMDADDLSVTGRLAQQVRWMQDHPEAVACGTDYELYGAMTGRVRMPRSDRACRDRMLLGSAHCGASIMMRRSVIDDAGLRFDSAYAHAEDYEFFTRLSQFGEIGNLPILGYRYFIHETQTSAVHGDAQRRAHLRIAARYADRIGAGELPDDALADLLWPHRDGRSSLAVPVRAATGAVRRRPSVETARFAGRKVVEAYLSR